MCHFDSFASIIPSEARNLSIMLRTGSGRNLIFSSGYTGKISRFARNDKFLILFTGSSTLDIHR